INVLARGNDCKSVSSRATTADAAANSCCACVTRGVSSGCFDHVCMRDTAVCRCFIPTCARTTSFLYVLYVWYPTIANPDPSVHMSKKTRTTRENVLALRFCLLSLPSALPLLGR